MIGTVIITLGGAPPSRRHRLGSETLPGQPARTPASPPAEQAASRRLFGEVLS